MEREKMIKELRKIAEVLTGSWCRKGLCTQNQCTIDDCDLMTQAKEIYDNGYRKVPEGAIVLTRERRDEVRREYNRGRAEIEERVRKETARDIYFDYEKNIKAMYGAFDVVDAYSILEELKEICEKNGADFNDGVEVEE